MAFRILIVSLSALFVGASAVAQINIVPAFYSNSDFSDSTVVIKTLELKKDKWEPQYSYTNSFQYKDHRLVRAVIYDQEYVLLYKSDHIAVSVSEKKKDISFYKYIYDSSRKISHAEHYIYEKGKKVSWGSEHFDYDSAGRLTSSNYVVQNSKSMHPGYEHNRKYVYDASGRRVAELRGYGKLEYFYNENNELSYALGEDNEFGRRRYKEVYTITKTK
jgi:hypothetical protein